MNIQEKIVEQKNRARQQIKNILDWSKKTAKCSECKKSKCEEYGNCTGKNHNPTDGFWCHGHHTTSTAEEIASIEMTEWSMKIQGLSKERVEAALRPFTVEESWVPATEEKSHHYKIIETFVGGEFPEKKAKVLMESIGLLLASERQRIAEVCLGAVEQFLREAMRPYPNAEAWSREYLEDVLAAKKKLITALKNEGVIMG